MTDLDRGPRVDLLPHPGQLDAALAQVHRRRRRSAARVGVSVVAAFAVVLVAGRVGVRDTAGLQPAVQGVATTAAAVPEAEGHRGETPDATGPRSATSAPGPTAATRPPQPSSTAIQPVPFRARAPIVQDYVTAAQCPPPCDPVRLTPGGAGGIRFEFTDPTLHGGPVWFATEQEVEITVLRGADDDAWTWGDGQYFAPDRHYVTSPVGSYLRWRGTWDLIRDDGTRLAPGSYRLRVDYLTGDTARTQYDAMFFIDEDGKLTIAQESLGSVLRP